LRSLPPLRHLSGFHVDTINPLQSLRLHWLLLPFF